MKSGQIGSGWWNSEEISTHIKFTVKVKWNLIIMQNIAKWGKNLRIESFTSTIHGKVILTTIRRFC